MVTTGTNFSGSTSIVILITTTRLFQKIKQDSYIIKIEEPIEYDIYKHMKVYQDDILSFEDICYLQQIQFTITKEEIYREIFLCRQYFCLVQLLLNLNSYKYHHSKNHLLKFFQL